MNIQRNRISAAVSAIIFMWLGLWTLPAVAAKIEVIGLFKHRAVTLIDGKRRVLKVGIASPEGAMLLSANSKKAIIEMEGVRKTYFLGTRIGGLSKEPTLAEARLLADRNGMFFTFGTINGQSVHFLVDTGATTIAMNSNDAARLGIDYKVYGRPSLVSTASGTAKAFAVKLKTVKVGALSLRNVSAMILEGDSPKEVLLGMSFLGRVRVEHSSNVMLLQQKF